MSDSPASGADWRTIRRNTWKSVRVFLLIAGFQIVGGLLLSLAYKQGLIGAESMIRGVMVIIGLGLAAAGNMIPKVTDSPPPPTLHLAALRQKALRTAGWMMMLGGLAFAGLSALLPLTVGPMAATAALGAFMTAGLGCVAYWIHAYHRSPDR